MTRRKRQTGNSYDVGRQQKYICGKLMFRYFFLRDLVTCRQLMIKQMSLWPKPMNMLIVIISTKTYQTQGKIVELSLRYKIKLETPIIRYGMALANVLIYKDKSIFITYSNFTTIKPSTSINVVFSSANMHFSKWKFLKGGDLWCHHVSGQTREDFHTHGHEFQTRI